MLVVRVKNGYKSGIAMLKFRRVLEVHNFSPKQHCDHKDSEERVQSFQIGNNKTLTNEEEPYKYRAKSTSVGFCPQETRAVVEFAKTKQVH